MYSTFDKIPEAVADYSEAIRLAPRNTRYLHTRGYLYLMTLGEYEKAAADFTAEIQVNPDNKNYYFCRAWAYSKLGNYPDAIRDYNRIIRLAPRDSNAHGHLARCFMAIGQPEEAAAYADKAVEYGPNNEWAYYHRGNVRAEQGEVDGAIADLTRFLQSGQSDSGVSANLATACFAKGDYRSALNHVREAIIHDPKERLAPYLVAIGYFAAHRVSDAPGADQLLKDAVTPTVWPAPILQFLRGKLTEEQLFDAVTDSDKQTEAHCYTGLMALKRDDKDSALRHFNWIAQNGNQKFLEYRIASAELDRLKGVKK